jgi:hypothetical protein
MKHPAMLPTYGEEGQGCKPKYSNERDYSIGTSKGPHQNGQANRDDSSSFSDIEKAEFGLVTRSPL